MGGVIFNQMVERCLQSPHTNTHTTTGPSPYACACAWGRYAYISAMDNRMTRRRRTLYTQDQLAALLGCTRATVARLERSFLTKRQRSYLDAVGYTVGYYPIRKAGKVDEGAPPR